MLQCCYVSYLHTRLLAEHFCNFLFNKTNRRTDFPNLFCQEILHVSGSSSAQYQEFSTVHSALVYVRLVCRQLESFRTFIKTLWHITSAECTVENSWWWVEELPEKCRVSWQNKFGKSVRLLVLLKSNLLRWRPHERKKMVHRLMKQNDC